VKQQKHNNVTVGQIYITDCDALLADTFRMGPGTPFPLVPSLRRLLLFFTFLFSPWL